MKIIPYVKPKDAEVFYDTKDRFIIEEEDYLEIKTRVGNITDTSAFDCKIMFVEMEQPVVVESGHSYERENILRSFERNLNCPVTQRPLKEYGFIPNLTLLSAKSSYQALKTYINEMMELIRCLYENEAVDDLSVIDQDLSIHLIPLICPLSDQPLNDTVVIASDGYSYNQSDLSYWLNGHNRSVVSNERFSHKRFYVNYSLRDAINDINELYTLASDMQAMAKSVVLTTSSTRNPASGDENQDNLQTRKFIEISQESIRTQEQLLNTLMTLADQFPQLSRSLNKDQKQVIAQYLTLQDNRHSSSAMSYIT